MGKEKPKFRAYAILIMGTLLLIALFAKEPISTSAIPKSDKLIEGIVTSVEQKEQNQELGIRLKTEKKISVENQADLELSPNHYQEGDKVVVLQSRSPENSITYHIIDYSRRNQIYILFAIFVSIVLLITRWQGLSSMIGMFFSYLILFSIILPRLLEGSDPVMTTILGTALIIPVTFYISHGINRKTSVAVIGTVCTLIITSLLAKLFVGLSHISGLSSDEAATLQLDPTLNIDFTGLFLAGIIISTLGVLDDITISQSSLVSELKSTKNNIDFKELFSRAMNVGRDHIASIVNTLILVYTGAALPLFLFFIDQSRAFSEVLNYEIVAQELIQMLVGSIGLVLAVPLTTILAVYFGKADKNNHHHHH